MLLACTNGLVLMMMHLFLGQFSNCDPFMIHTEVILVCDDGRLLLHSAALGEMGD